MHLQNVPKLACNIPLILTQLILPQFHIMIAGDGIDGSDVLDGEVKLLVLGLVLQLPLS
jgi:hypothetical protein